MRSRTSADSPNPSYQLDLDLPDTPKTFLDMDCPSARFPIEVPSVTSAQRAVNLQLISAEAGQEVTYLGFPHQLSDDLYEALSCTRGKH